MVISFLVCSSRPSVFPSSVQITQHPPFEHLLGRYACCFDSSDHIFAPNHLSYDLRSTDRSTARIFYLASLRRGFLCSFILSFASCRRCWCTSCVTLCRLASSTRPRHDTRVELLRQLLRSRRSPPFELHFSCRLGPQPFFDGCKEVVHV
jgi:hypothetical protein